MAPNSDPKRRESDCSVNSFDFDESVVAEEEDFGELLSSNIEIDADKIKVDVKVEDMLGDLSWYFDNSDKKTKKGKSETAKGEEEKSEDQNEENVSDEFED